jgi:arylsulfatase A-like enzyme
VKSPNIILFLTDDHAAWALNHAGASDLPTPNLDRLAAQGTRFTEAFTPSPVCSPARACLMTGLPPSQTGIHDWLQEYDDAVAARDWLKGFDTLPEMFQRAGYQTYLSGKWHLGATPALPRGFDHAFGYGRKTASHNGAGCYTIDGETVELEGNRSELTGRHACRFLQDADRERPFFLNVGLFATHSPYVEAAHDPEIIAQLEAHDFPDLPRTELHPDAKPENGPATDADPETERRKRWRGYYAGVMEIDRELGRILDTLQSTGREEDTLIVYTADHGCCLGHHGVWGKGNGTRPLNFYDTSLRVPLILKGPGWAAGHSVQMPVTHYDSFATLKDLCGLQPADGHLRPGHSLSSINQIAPHHRLDRTTFHEYGDARAVRTSEWKRIERYGHGPDEAFDLSNDPGENHPLPASAAPPELAESLHAFYRDYDQGKYSGLHARQLPRHNDHEAWRDGLREQSLVTSGTCAR